ncbi:MAG: hypothetical protein HKM93_21730 [Desulfobacteraceae bacterium]|nr:hypothetical protein [Desulfobacteraceae bacterium]
MKSSDATHTEAFDREFSLAEILPEKHIVSILNESHSDFIENAVILDTRGRCYYSVVPLDRPDLTVIQRHVSQDDISRESICATLGSYFHAFRLVHEMETMGFVFLKFHPEWPPPEKVAGAAVGIIRAILKQTMKMTYGNLLTGRLHSKVVEDSYEDLKKKNEALRRSERKYRQLSAQLEIEVAKKAEQIKKAHATLMQKEKMAAIGHLAAGVAHEINNPMGFIISNINTVKSGLEDCLKMIARYRQAISHPFTAKNIDAQTANRLEAYYQDLDIDYFNEESADIITETLDGAARIKNIVDDLKAFALPGAQEADHVDLNTSLTTVLNIMKPEIPEGIRVVLHLSEIPAVCCHAPHMNQVLYSIIINAVQAIEGAGKIQITSGVHDNHVEISVSDTGHGIPADALSKIFDPFFTTKDVGQGTGLGLHLAYKVLELYDGVLSADSTPGQGCAFKIRIPVTVETPAQQKQADGHV